MFFYWLAHVLAIIGLWPSTKSDADTLTCVQLSVVWKWPYWMSWLSSWAYWTFMATASRKTLIQVSPHSKEVLSSFNGPEHSRLDESALRESENLNPCFPGFTQVVGRRISVFWNISFKLWNVYSFRGRMTCQRCSTWLFLFRASNWWKERR